jgi:hypothetical protein
MRSQFGVAHRVLDVFMAELHLQRPGCRAVRCAFDVAVVAARAGVEITVVAPCLEGALCCGYSRSMQPLPLNQRLDRIGQHIVRARLFLDLWFYFEERDSRCKIIETMREYNEFFRFTPHAYFVAYVIYMAGVFDKRPGTISLPPLVREVKTLGQLKGQDAAAVDALLVGAKSVVDKVLILRHEAFAHRSAHISYNDVFTMAAVKPDELRDLTDKALKIANRLLLARGLEDQYFTELPREAAEAMMKALRVKGP